MTGASTRGPRADAGQLRDALSRSRVLRRAADATVDTLARASTLRTYAAQEVVFRAGAASDGMFVVVEGQVAARLANPAGGIVDVATAGPGELIGYLELFDGAPRDVDAVALRRSTLVGVPFSAARAAIATDPELVTALATDLVAIVREFDAETLRRTFSPLPARLAALLLDLARDGRSLHGPGRAGWRLVHLEGSQTQLAQRLGVARQTLNRTLHGLADRGFVALHPGGRSLDVDTVGLAALARHDGDVDVGTSRHGAGPRG